MARRFFTSAAVCVWLVNACAHGPRTGEPPGAPPAPEATLAPGATTLLGEIPRCSAGTPTVSPHQVRELETGTKVAVRGFLVHQTRWDCTRKACSPEKRPDGRRVPGTCCNTCTTPWFVVDALEVSRPYMSRARLYLRERGQAEPLALRSGDCEVRAVNAAVPPRNVVVSGVFQGSAGQGGGSYLLDDVHVCQP